MDYRRTYYDRTGRFPRTLKQAFGPYADEDMNVRPLMSDATVFACVCALAVILFALMAWGVIW